MFSEQGVYLQWWIDEEVKRGNRIKASKLNRALEKMRIKKTEWQEEELRKKAAKQSWV